MKNTKSTIQRLQAKVDLRPEAEALAALADAAGLRSDWRGADDAGIEFRVVGRGLDNAARSSREAHVCLKFENLEVYVSLASVLALASLPCRHDTEE
jgi:hypothetical protein